MKNKYLVIEYGAGAYRRNIETPCASLDEAVNVCRRMIGDRDENYGIGSSSIFKNEQHIAARDWDKSRITWA